MFKNRCLKLKILFLVDILFFSIFFSCGDNPTKTSTPILLSPSVSVTVSKAPTVIITIIKTLTPTLSPTIPILITSSPVPTIVSTSYFWVAKNNSYTIEKIANTGISTDTSINLKNLSEFSSLTSGGITALTTIATDTLLAFIDPGTSGEKIVKINVSDNTVNTWFYDATNYKNILVDKMLYINATAPRVFIPYLETTSSGIDRFNVLENNTSGNYATMIGTHPYISNTLSSNCIAGTIESSIKLQSSNGEYAALILSKNNDSVSTGANKLFLLTGLSTDVSVPNCINSLDYSVDSNLDSTYYADKAIQNSTDKKVYILYKSSDTSKKVALIQYTYSGTTLLSPVLIHNAGNITSNATALMFLNSTTLLVSDGNFIHKFNVNTKEYLGSWSQSWIDGYISALEN